MTAMDPLAAAPFTPQDLVRMRMEGISEEKALAQLEIFRHGSVFARLEKACAVNDGIVRLSRTEMDSLSALYAAAVVQGRVMQFVPASGAATRLFKGLIAVLGRADSPAFSVLAKEAGSQPDAKEFLDFFMGLPLFPFKDGLAESMHRSGLDFQTLYDAKDYRPILEHLLLPKGLGFADRPKALIPFHRYNGGTRTALEEHLVEAAALARDSRGVSRIHFTVSGEHEAEIQALLDNARGKFEAAGTRLVIGLSRQKSSTNTLAVDMDGRPLREADGSLVFRPGGHGALLENLRQTGGDIVFIKNIEEFHEACVP